MEEVQKDQAVLEINFMDAPEHPQMFLSWELYSFSNRHSNYSSPEKYAHRLSRVNSPVSKASWLKKLNANTGFWLDCYQHSGIIWSMHGEGMQCRFDTAPWGGVLVGNYSDLKKMTHSEREESARKALDIYNSYFNGAVFEFNLRIKGLSDADNTDNDLITEGWFDDYYDGNDLIRDVVDQLKIHNLDLEQITGSASYIFDFSHFKKEMERRNDAV